MATKSFVVGLTAAGLALGAAVWRQRLLAGVETLTTLL